ncbi:hypothetical protein HAX54_016739 [Datura stramonium]|uniref:Uncharacterized protein n=1 Tax=Datura stramonium TaxID=4076 RepID=A0ABS8ULC4_DATST|nr:hypothetical protein [Datura stramonium]
MANMEGPLDIFQGSLPRCTNSSWALSQMISFCGNPTERLAVNFQIRIHAFHSSLQLYLHFIPFGVLLDIPKLLWIKMEYIGHRTLYVEKERSMRINGSMLGGRRNCLYFTQQIDLFDMQEKAISPAPQSSLSGIE